MAQSDNRVIEPGRDTPVIGEYEVVVLGGGPAGIAAAAAAARSGRSTVLIERYGFLGGAGTAAGLSTFCGLHANVRGEHRQVIHGIADELLERLQRMGGLNAPHLSLGSRIQAQAYDISAYKIAADELLLSSGVKILFHAFGAGMVKRAEREIDALLIESKSGRAAIRGRLFIDCSGDGDLAAWAGAPYEIGDGAGNMLYPSTMFRINGVDPARAGRAWESIPQLMAEAERRGERSFPRKGAIVRPQKNPIEWRANLTQIRNPDGSAVSGIDLEQMSYGEVEGRRQCREVFEFIRGVTPGFENAYIVEIAPQLGIRETRRITGDYPLSESDILGCADFADSIGVNGWPVEAHVPGSVLLKFPAQGSRGYNQLPYRMIVPRGVDNLLVAGRCASMTHDGQSSSRVSGPCFAMGQAAGTAADLALAAGVAPRAIDVARLQQRLTAAGAWLGFEPGHAAPASSEAATPAESRRAIPTPRRRPRPPGAAWRSAARR
ncbi:MAG TPA: FAD-dependent oxidoreductase [Burkholderiales bacterium]|nr:FAD-dependent oxidoreductase [Burkholderiales bacterium]